MRSLIGRRFGKLVITGLAQSRTRGRGSSRSSCAYVAVVCDCGIVKETRRDNLVNGHTKSCGCSAGQKRLPIGEATIRAYLKRYKLGAKSRGLKWILSRTQFVELISGNCYYCGEPPKVTSISRHFFPVNGVDRLIGGDYAYLNCVTCCGVCNKLKMNMTLDQFKNQIFKIVNHLKEK